MLPYFFHPLAAIEFEEAVAYYESLHPGKGLELAVQVESALEQIRTFPESAPISRGMVRSVVIQPAGRWSYSLHYRVKATQIRVLALAHHKRQPFYWLGRR